MGRNSKPIDLIVMEGKTHKTKEEIRQRRERERELRPNSINIECPRWLCDVGRNEWKRIENDLMELGLLTNIDVSQLAIYCDAYAQYVRAAEEINTNGLLVETNDKTGAVVTGSNPYIPIAMKYAEIVKKFCDGFGLSPSSRARMAIPNKSDPGANSKEEKFRGLI